MKLIVKIFDLLFPYCREYKLVNGCGYKKGKRKRVFILKYLFYKRF